MNERVIWSNLKYRCNNPNAHNYHHYGGRGIKVCESWLLSFENFYQDMGPRPTKLHSVERKNVDGNYCPENCFWATNKQQSRNRRNNTLLTHNNKTQTMADWADEYDMDYHLLCSRINSLGWSVEKALNTKVVDGNYEIEIDGITKKLKDWLLHYDLNYDTYYSRIYKGMDVKKALTTPKLKKILEYNGRRLSLKEWSKELNIAYRTILYRLRKGWDVERIFETPVKVYKK